MCAPAREWPRSPPRDGDREPVAQLAHVVGLGERDGAAGQPGQQNPCLLPHRSKRIDQQLPIIGVHPADRLVLTAQRSHRKHVVEVAVGQQRRNRMEAVFTDHVGNSVRRVHAWIDDDALPADGSSDHSAGLPGPGGERRDKHSSENIGQD